MNNMIKLGRCFVFILGLIFVQSKNIFNPLIIEGQEAYLGEFPWHVLLKPESYGEVLCGGSIINKDWVMTAGHCTYKLVFGVFVIYGNVLKNDHKHSQQVPMENIIIHPEYVHQTLRNDISLIKLVTPLEFNDFIKPIALSFDDTLKLKGKLAVVTGFGVMSDDILDFSDHLMKTTMQIVDNYACGAMYNRPGFTIVTEANVCAKPPKGKKNNICSGDSGGALIIEHGGKRVQVGINSFAAKEACMEEKPSGFARVSKFESFIMDNINSKS